MHLSIIGSPLCGKTTLFKALAGSEGRAGGQGKAGVAVIDVPDERVDRLSRIFHPKKTVYGRIEVCDTDSIHEGDMKAGAVPAGLLRQMRPADAFIVVLNHFDAAGLNNAGGAEAASALRALVNELMIADMVQIEGRLERIKKQAGRKEAALEQEKAALEQCLVHLEQGAPLSSLPLFASDGKLLRGFQFLSLKPLMIVVNCSEGAMRDGAPVRDEVSCRIAGAAPDAPVIAACAGLEAELAVMGEADRAAFMAEYGIAESLKGSIIRLAYETLGLISFLTVGEDECRAWPVRRGTTAQEAAATIHTDLSERFIRAETVAYDDFMAYGDFAGCKKAGVWRLEGKQYIVKDGDIISVRSGA
jgi:hypothetical protein